MRALRLAAALLALPAVAAAAAPSTRLALFVESAPGDTELGRRLETLLNPRALEALFPPEPPVTLPVLLTARGYRTAALFLAGAGPIPGGLRGFASVSVSSGTELAEPALAGELPSFTLVVAPDPRRQARLAGAGLRRRGETAAAVAVVEYGADGPRLFWEIPRSPAGPPSFSRCALDVSAALLAYSGEEAAGPSRCAPDVRALPDGAGYRVEAGGEELTWRRGSAVLDGDVVERSPERAAALMRRLLESLESRSVRLPPAPRSKGAADLDRALEGLRRLGYIAP